MPHSSAAEALRRIAPLLDQPGARDSDYAAFVRLIGRAMAAPPRKPRP